MNKSFTLKPSVLNRFLRGLVSLYQQVRQIFLDPLLYSAFGVASSCRYEESCSQYAQRMLREHATIPALGKIVRRIWSCHS